MCIRDRGFYHRPLTVIRPIDIENFLKGLRRDGRSASYISTARGMLYQIFQKAEANDLVRRNPVRLAEKRRASGTAKRKEAFTTAEVAHLMKVLPDDRMGDVYKRQMEGTVIFYWGNASKKACLLP